MEEQEVLYNLRLNRLEQLTSSMVESQASMVQILQAHTKELQEMNKRLDILEEQMAQVMTDVAFIRNYIETRGLD